MRPNYQSPREDVWITCSKCATPMVPLRDYDLTKSSEAATPGADLWEYLLFGWWAFVFNYVYDLFTLEGRKKQLQQLKATVLPQFPGSQVCPRCLQIKRMA